jgi:large subunit ribosomal protein L30e
VVKNPEKLKRKIREAIDANLVILGYKRTVKAIKRGELESVILPQNCPFKKDIVYYSRLAKVKILKFSGNTLELGELCRRPFSVSVVGIRSA